MRKTAVWCSIFLLAFVLAPGTVQAQGHFLRGDSNLDMDLDVSDAVFTLLYLFHGSVTPLCLDALDFDDSGQINLTDAIDLLQFAFLSGAPPAAPFPIFEADPTADELNCLPEMAGPVTEGGSVITGDIAVDVTLTRDKTYRIVSNAFFKAGTTLTIEAGVTILGDSATKGVLAVERGAHIFAVGTSTHPIVFTSDKSVGLRRRGDWGGVIICGRGPTNVVGGEWVVKGFKSLMAGGGATPDPEESSGRLSYARFEYAGASVGDATPATLTAITFCALGSGTQLDHIMAKQTLDDGLEWYGGTCNLKYGLAVASEDEGVDCEYGWQGHAQFIACMQKPSAGNQGWMFAEDDTQPLLEPRTLPTVCNVTLLGAYASGSRSQYGIRVKRFAGVNFYNGILQGWHDAGVYFGSDYGPVSIDRCAFYGNEDDCGGSTSACAQLFEAPLVNIVATQSTVVDASDIENANLRGVASTLPEPLDPTTIDPWFEPVTYAGAVPPEGQGEDWTRESWISWQIQ